MNLALSSEVYKITNIFHKLGSGMSLPSIRTPNLSAEKLSLSTNDAKPPGMGLSPSDQLQVGLFNHQDKIVDCAFEALQSASINIQLTDFDPEFWRVLIEVPDGLFFRRYNDRNPRNARGQVAHKVRTASRHYHTYSFRVSLNLNLRVSLSPLATREDVVTLGSHPLVVEKAPGGYLTISVQSMWKVEPVQKTPTPVGTDYVQKLEDALCVIRDSDTSSSGDIGEFAKIAKEALRGSSV